MNAPSITPHLTIDRARAAIAFYENAFGFKVTRLQETPDKTKIVHCSMEDDRGGVVMLSDSFPEMHQGEKRTPEALGGTPVTIHLDVPDVDAVWARAVKAGASVAMPLQDTFWGARYGVVTDPFGHRWSLATQKSNPTQEKLDEGAQKYFPKKP
ncbi:VOC family protein [Pendulispora albinea]|uniref:Glyoxalase/bleomycin resistance/extradiol dioxygenase family protein n=1 Tax=Pendulispora albinea TaxID=2741071 RepID=A0ABZ2M1J0_9BACT